MSITVQSVYEAVTDVLLEPGGFVLGIVTDAQFLDMLANALLDFNERAPLDKTVFTTMINAGVGDYIVPENVTTPELLFVNARLIEKTTEQGLNYGHRQWRRKTGPPEQWHEDNLAVKHVEIVPKPDFNGANIAGDAPPIGVYGDFQPGSRNLTIVGPGAPSQTAWALNDTLDGIPDIFAPYLAFRILEEIFSSDSEARDPQRAAYCHTRWEEGISVSQVIVSQELMEEE